MGEIIAGSIVLPCQPGLILGTHAHFSMGKWKGELKHVWQYHAATQSKSPSAIKNEMVKPYRNKIVIPLYETPGEEWRIHLLYLQFLFLTAWPVMDVRLICKSRGNDYPPEIPRHITKVLQLDIKEPYTLIDVECAATSKVTWTWAQALIFLPCQLLRSLRNEDVLRGIAQSVLKTLAEDVKHRVNGSWVADYREFKREKKPKIEV